MSNKCLLVSQYEFAGENSQLALHRHLGVPFPANSPIESAKQALLNLTDLEWQEIWDWLGENHWLPPGVN